MIAKHKFWFFLMPAAFLVGICLGSLSFGKTDFQSFFTTASESLSSSTLMADSFLKAVRQNAIHLALFCIFGTTIIGAVPSAVLLAVRGYGLGQTVGALVSAFGFRGFLAATVGIFPHNLIYVPFFCLTAVCGAVFSAHLLTRDRDAHRRLISYLLTSLVLAVPVFIGCLIEGYVSAPLLRSILSPIL